MYFRSPCITSSLTLRTITICSPDNNRYNFTRSYANVLVNVKYTNIHLLVMRCQSSNPRNCYVHYCCYSILEKLLMSQTLTAYIIALATHNAILRSSTVDIIPIYKHKTLLTIYKHETLLTIYKHETLLTIYLNTKPCLYKHETLLYINNNI